ncbi:hypothetical protein [Tranquillimonas rosea]|uniref:hypothetical protein n=1 Tax=Tranquillimonas rosea TaxID=641238 RepID=UPI003BAA0A3D
MTVIARRQIAATGTGLLDVPFPSAGLTGWIDVAQGNNDTGPTEFSDVRSAATYPVRGSEAVSLGTVNGITVGTATMTAGNSRRGIVMPGSLVSGKSAITLAALVKPDDAGSTAIFGAAVDGNTSPFVELGVTGDPYARLVVRHTSMSEDPEIFTTARYLDFTQWFGLIGMIDYADKRLYLEAVSDNIDDPANNQRRSTNAFAGIAGSVSGSPSNLALGFLSRAGASNEDIWRGSRYEGMVKHGMVFDRILNAQQLAEMRRYLRMYSRALNR